MKKAGAVLLGIAAFAAASVVSADDDQGSNRVSARLTGYQEVPSVSTVASGRFHALIHDDGQGFDWEIEFSGLQGTVAQSHIHFGQRGVNGAIVVWLCQGTVAGPAGTAICPQSGTVTGTAMAGNVGPGSATQQLNPGEIAEVIAAMRAGVAYANVHTSISPGGEIRGRIHPRGRGGDNRDDDHGHHGH